MTKEVKGSHSVLGTEEDCPEMVTTTRSSKENAKYCNNESKKMGHQIKVTEYTYSGSPMWRKRKILRRRRKSLRSQTTWWTVAVVFLAVLLAGFDTQKCRFVTKAYQDDDAGYGGDDAGDDADDAAVARDDVGNDERLYYIDDYVSFKDDEGNYVFDQVSIMPVSCLQYNNGHLIKFELFDANNNYQCHFRNLGTFVVSIAHYMRAYFNQEALLNGKQFNLPGDAGYLNCVLLQQTAYSNQKLYAKIGCMDRETYTSTKLQLHVYTDKQCSVPYDDEQSDRYHSSKGYDINGYTFSTRVSFRPPFYSCRTCVPQQISETFKKQYYWYDDDYISEFGKKMNNKAKNDDDDDDYLDDGGYAYDDLYGNDGDDANKLDDKYYYVANDDVGDDDAGDDGRRLSEPGGVAVRRLEAADGALRRYRHDFWRGFEEIKRSLYNNDDVVNSWNFCDRVYKYGVWCDEDCRAFDTFRVDEWSRSDVFLLVIMVIFMAMMMLLVFAKRVKAYEKARKFDDDAAAQYPGLPPMAMVLLFTLIMITILVLANLKFVNETLVFAVVQCILLFIYMLKLTLFERQTPSHQLPTSRRKNQLKQHFLD